MKPFLYFFKQLYLYSGKKLYINVFGMVFIGLLDGIGLLLLIPVINYSGIVNFHAEGTSFNKPLLYLQQLFDSLGGLAFVLVVFIFINILQSFLQRMITIENVKIQHGFSKSLRREIYRDLLYANWDFYVRRRKTDIINTITAELGRVSAGINTLVQLMASMIFTVIQVAIAFMLSPTITMFVLGSGLILSVFSRGFIRRSRMLGSRTSEIGQSFLAGITDSFNGMKEIKSNTLERSRVEWSHTITQRMYDEQLEYTTLKTASQFYYKSASAVLIAIFIFLSVQLFNAQAAQLMLIIIIFGRLWPRVTGIQASMEQIAATIPALESVIQLKKESQTAREQENFTNSEPIVIEKGIECKKVFFRYNKKANTYAMKNIDVFFPSNCMTAVIGKSGAGKSTLVDLLMGLNRPERGEILLDGIQLTERNLHSLRRSISYVPQDPFLFNTTVRENLSLIQPNASEDQLWDALRFAAADDFVKRLPQGLDTLIGDRGIRLSGGERQRLVLARAILREPTILVLDEATSALDSENETNIQEALEKLKGKMTIIIIAHRLSTIRNADQVIVLDKGEIIQQGEFRDLAKEQRGMFNHLLKQQIKLSL